MLHHYSIASGIIAFSTTRHGGVSEGNYAAFNVNHYCGDNPHHIAENRQQLCRCLGIDESRLIYPHQTHHTEVWQVDDSFLTWADSERSKALEGIDALMTDCRGVCIGVSTADCIPVLLYDAVHHAVAAIHAGWRGTVGRIVEKTVVAMQQVYQTNPADLQVVIGPGISLTHFEVGDEVYDTFVANGFPMNQLAARFPASTGERWHIDLPACNRWQLLQTGVKADAITDTAICTFAQVDEFFSARRLGINSGRILTAIMIK